MDDTRLGFTLKGIGITRPYTTSGIRSNDTNKTSSINHKIKNYSLIAAGDIDDLLSDATYEAYQQNESWHKSHNHQLLALQKKIHVLSKSLHDTIIQRDSALSRTTQLESLLANNLNNFESNVRSELEYILKCLKDNESSYIQSIGDQYTVDADDEQNNIYAQSDSQGLIRIFSDIIFSMGNKIISLESNQNSSCQMSQLQQFEGDETSLASKESLIKSTMTTLNMEHTSNSNNNKKNKYYNNDNIDGIDNVNGIVVTNESSFTKNDDSQRDTDTESYNLNNKKTLEGNRNEQLHELSSHRPYKSRQTRGILKKNSFEEVYGGNRRDFDDNDSQRDGLRIKKGKVILEDTKSGDRKAGKEEEFDAHEYNAYNVDEIKEESEIATIRRAERERARKSKLKQGIAEWNLPPNRSFPNQSKFIPQIKLPSTSNCSDEVSQSLDIKIDNNVSSSAISFPLPTSPVQRREDNSQSNDFRLHMRANASITTTSTTTSTKTNSKEDMVAPFLEVLRYHEKKLVRENGFLRIQLREARTLIQSLENELYCVTITGCDPKYEFQKIKDLRKRIINSMWIFDPKAIPVPSDTNDPIKIAGFISNAEQYAKSSTNLEEKEDKSSGESKILCELKHIKSQLQRKVGNMGNWPALLYSQEGIVDRQFDLSAWSDKERVAILIEMVSSICYEEQIIKEKLNEELNEALRELRTLRDKEQERQRIEKEKEMERRLEEKREKARETERERERKRLD